MQAGFHRRIPLTMKVGRRGAVALGAELFAVLLVMQARDLWGGGSSCCEPRAKAGSQVIGRLVPWQC